MFVFNQDMIAKETGEGITRKVLAYGEKLMLCELTLRKGAVIAEHTHPHEQCTYIISGKLRFAVGDEAMEVGSGDTVLAPGNISHGVIVLEDAVTVDIFSPIREDFI